MRPEGIKRTDWINYNCLFVFEHFLGFRLFEKFFGVTRRNLFKKMDVYLKESGRGENCEIKNVSKDITKEEFIEQCYNPVLPKIFKGAAKEWQVVKKWNLDFFEQYHGDKEVILNDNVGITTQTFEKLDLKYYIKQLRSGSLKYLKFSDIVNDDENLKNDFDLKWLRRFNMRFSWAEDLKMFMGGKGTITPIHVGFSGFLFVQVMGKKKWILYPPGERIFLDPRTERIFYYYSNANPYNTNDPDFPLLKYAKKYEVVLEPGDVLWVPPFTWHHVENHTDSIGIRYGRSSIPSSFKSSKMLTILFFLATKPNIISHLYTSLRNKRSYEHIKSQSEIERSIFSRLNPFKKQHTE